MKELINIVQLKYDEINYVHHNLTPKILNENDVVAILRRFIRRNPDDLEKTMLWWSGIDKRSQIAKARRIKRKLDSKGMGI